MVLEFRKCKERDSCLAACISSLLDRDDVPHFFDGRSSEEAWVELRKWVRSQDRELVLFPYEEDPRPMMKDMMNENYYILMCDNGHGDHAVICKGDEKVFDPGWITSPICGPMRAGFWLVGVIV